MKYSESTLKTWTSPLSQTEEQRVQNTIEMIRGALNSSVKLKSIDMQVFAQGSYANNTNVRNNSDIDICVMCTSTFYYDLPEGKTKEQYDIYDSSLSFEDYKSYILEAMRDKFGFYNVSVGNKSIKISSNTYHVQADVVPAFEYRDYNTYGGYYEGVRFFAKDFSRVTNYPKIHIENGRYKNNATGHKYKRLVRILKHVRNNMVDEGIIDGDVISSFLVECLVWNVPNKVITLRTSWNATLIEVIAYLYKEIEDGNQDEWGEVSERLYLFHAGRKWTANDAKLFLLKAWNYLGYADD